MDDEKKTTRKVPRGPSGEIARPRGITVKSNVRAGGLAHVDGELHRPPVAATPDLPLVTERIERKS